jgi:hypothetical protein
MKKPILSMILAFLTVNQRVVGSSPTGGAQPDSLELASGLFSLEATSELNIDSAASFPKSSV